MRKARNVDGSFKFGASRYLTSQQVASFFSRLAAKRVAAADESQDEETEHHEEMDMIQEQSIEELRKSRRKFHFSIQLCTIHITFVN